MMRSWSASGGEEAGARASLCLCASSAQQRRTRRMTQPWSSSSARSATPRSCSNSSRPSGISSKRTLRPMSHVTAGWTDFSTTLIASPSSWRMLCSAISARLRRPRGTVTLNACSSSSKRAKPSHPGWRLPYRLRRRAATRPACRHYCGRGAPPPLTSRVATPCVQRQVRGTPRSSKCCLRPRRTRTAPTLVLRRPQDRVR
mmetsp:Transcript_1527/g.4939  ORF Transcript_1527/g.4939 Transcript_1527/m.4939 type:complete len:201 (+) Transcript_1527:181-783(+)